MTDLSASAPRAFTLSDFDFALPPALIAQHPAPERSASRLLDGRAAEPVDRVFRELPGLLRAGDGIAHLSADEFVLLFHELGSDAETASRHALSVAEKIHSALAEPFVLAGEADAVTITASLGITLCPQGPDDEPAEALRRADTALRRAKAGG